MALFEKISSFADGAVKQGGKFAKNTGKIAALKLSSHNAQEEINKLYAKIGERYYKAHGLAPEQGFEKLCDKVTELRGVINENQAAIEEIKIDGVIDEVVVDPDELD